MKRALDGFDATEQLALYKDHPTIFHILGYSPTSGAAYLTRNPHENRLILAYNKIFSASGLDIYDIKLNSIEGLSVGFLFHSPLKLKGDAFYLLFYRRHKDITSSIVERRMVARSLVFHSSAYLHYIVLRGIDSPIVKFLTE